MTHSGRTKKLMKMRILVGGGTGFIGKNLVNSLLSKEKNVVKLISRSPGPSKITWDEIYQNGLTENYDAIVNLTGENISQPFKWSADFAEKVRSSRIDTTRLLATCISKAESPPKVWISSSAVGYYAAHQTKKYTEYSTPGKDFFAKLCVDAENAAKLEEDSTTRHVILRTGVVLGRNGGAINNLYVPFYLGLGGRVGSGQQWFPWIGIRDMVGIIEHAINNENVKGALNCVAPACNTNQEFTTAFAAAMNRPACFPVPEFVMRTVFGPEVSKIMLEGQCVVPERTLESGYEYMHPDLKSVCEECSRNLAMKDYTY